MDRNEKTLVRWIKKLVEPGSTIYTDGWASYINLSMATYTLRWSIKMALRTTIGVRNSNKKLCLRRAQASHSHLGLASPDQQLREVAQAVQQLADVVEALEFARDVEVPLACPLEL